MTPSRTATLSLVTALACACALAQDTTPQPPVGKVLFSRSTGSDATTTQTHIGEASSSLPHDPGTAPLPPDEVPPVPVTDDERSSILVTANDLDLHLMPTNAGLEARSTLTLHNVTDHPIRRFPLQVSSTFHWLTISIDTDDALREAAFTQSPIATDTDHTGYAQEAVVTLPTPLASGASVTVTTFYAGEVRQSAARLELIGTPPSIAAETDWDRIGAGDDEAPITLRGFGNVLWYPCAAPVALLGDGNRLFDLVGRERLKGTEAKIRLRLTVEYVGEPPALAIFNGRAQQLEHAADTDDQLVAATHGVATTEFVAQPLGFRAPSLVVVAHQPIAGEGQTLSVATAHPAAAAPYAAAAKLVQPLISTWLGATPLSPLLLVDHAGQTFEDDALLVTPLQARANDEATASMMVHGLTHAWLRSSHPWIEEGLAQFMNLLWTEQTRGRRDALLELERQSNLIALAEPDLSGSGKTAGQPLAAASSEIYFRAKAAAVWWQLRDIVGDDKLKRSLQAYRHSEELNPQFDRDPRAFQTTLEKVSARNLEWFFDDWVNRDRGLPDLSIVSVATHPLPAREGKSAGYLVAVEVKNEGDAVCEVPVTIRSGELTASERLRVQAHASASTRIPFEGTPETVQVNDGSVPELRAAIHLRKIASQ